MEKEQVLSLLENKGIPYRLIHHAAAHTIDEMDELGVENGEEIAKNLFLRDDKKRNYYLICLQKDKTADLKALRQTLGCRPLSFASESDLQQYLALPKGAVTPFGALNDTEHKVHLRFDSTLAGFAAVGVHPNDNTATVFLKLADLMGLLQGLGSDVALVDLN